jgi:hypothetical protein
MLSTLYHERFASTNGGRNPSNGLKSWLGDQLYEGRGLRTRNRRRLLHRSRELLVHFVKASIPRACPGGESRNERRPRQKKSSKKSDPGNNSFTSYERMMTLGPVFSTRPLKALPEARYGTKSAQAGEATCACPSKRKRPGSLESIGRLIQFFYRVSRLTPEHRG